MEVLGWEIESVSIAIQAASFKILSFHFSSLYIIVVPLQSLLPITNGFDQIQVSNIQALSCGILETK